MSSKQGQAVKRIYSEALKPIIKQGLLQYNSLWVALIFKQKLNKCPKYVYKLSAALH